jgi:hypothetical protein
MQESALVRAPNHFKRMKGGLYIAKKYVFIAHYYTYYYLGFKEQGAHIFQNNF